MSIQFEGNRINLKEIGPDYLVSFKSESGKKIFVKVGSELEFDATLEFLTTKIASDRDYPVSVLGGCEGNENSRKFGEYILKGLRTVNTNVNTEHMWSDLSKDQSKIASIPSVQNKGNQILFPKPSINN